MLNSYAGSLRTRSRDAGLASWPVAALMCYALLASGAYAAESVTIELSGRISPRCEVSSLTTAIALGTLDAAGERELQFALHCNDPFTYELTSRYGGLKHTDTSTSGNASFSSLLPYSVDISIPTDDGVIASRCESPELQDGIGCGTQTSSGSAATNKTGSLIIRWQSTGMPIAGTYRDVLSVTLQPDL